MPRIEGEVSRLDPAARIASRQRGVASREQLRRAGLGDGAIDHRIAAGRLHPVHRGVFMVGHDAAPPLARETAALLACGPGAVLSHQTAARSWRLLEGVEATIDVTVAGKRRAQRHGIRLHRTGWLPRSQIRIRDGLAVTDPERTIFDLVAVLPGRELAAAFDAARAGRMLRERHLLSLIARFPTRRGTRALRALIAAPGFSRSKAERRMLGLVARAGLPRPQRNERVAGHEVDLHWPEHALIVEVDGYEFHSDRDAFEHDRRRDADLLAAGQSVIRVTWRQLVDEPEAVAVRLARAL